MSSLQDMIGLLQQIAEQAKHDQHRRSKARKEQAYREAEAAQAGREAELTERTAKLEELYLNEMKGLMENLSEEFAALLGQQDDVPAKPAKDAEVKRAADGMTEVLGSAEGAVKGLNDNLEAMEGVENNAVEAQLAAAAAKHKERAARAGKAVLNEKVGELKEASLKMAEVVTAVVGSLKGGSSDD